MRLERICKFCGRVFIPAWTSVWFCSVECRFWNYVNKTPDCWEWTGPTLKEYGYLKIEGKRIKAHRFSWMIHYGPIPEDSHVLHHCDYRLCIRPDHLFLGTDLDNVRDCIRKGRAWWQIRENSRPL